MCFACSHPEIGHVLVTSDKKNKQFTLNVSYNSKFNFAKQSRSNLVLIDVLLSKMEHHSQGNPSSPKKTNKNKIDSGNKKLKLT